MDRTDSPKNNLKLCERKKKPNGRPRKIVKYTSHGYLEIHKPNHHFTNKENHVLLHRFVYEYFHKVCLLRWGDIHHINGIKTDNQKRNLMAVSKVKHRKIHMKPLPEGTSFRYCLLCRSTVTYITKKGGPQWVRYSNGFACSKCYKRKKSVDDLSVLGLISR